MDFVQAMKQVKEGKAVTREDWNNAGIHCRMVLTTHPSPVLSIYNGAKGGERYHDWVISQEDVDADDWALTAVVPSMTGAGPRLEELRGEVQGLKKKLIETGKTLVARPNASPVAQKPAEEKEGGEA